MSPYLCFQATSFSFPEQTSKLLFSFLATAVIGGFSRTTENQTEQA